MSLATTCSAWVLWVQCSIREMREGGLLTWLFSGLVIWLPVQRKAWLFSGLVIKFRNLNTSPEKSQVSSPLSFACRDDVIHLCWAWQTMVSHCWGGDISGGMGSGGLIEGGILALKAITLWWWILDINECAAANGGCEQNCTNSIGSYNCSCISGYDLDPENNMTCTSKS